MQSNTPKSLNVEYWYYGVFLSLVPLRVIFFIHAGTSLGGYITCPSMRTIRLTNTSHLRATYFDLLCYFFITNKSVNFDYLAFYSIRIRTSARKGWVP
jgi:hypothetical protein